VEVQALELEALFQRRAQDSILEVMYALGCSPSEALAIWGMLEIVRGPYSCDLIASSCVLYSHAHQRLPRPFTREYPAQMLGLRMLAATHALHLRLLAMTLSIYSLYLVLTCACYMYLCPSQALRSVPELRHMYVADILYCTV
jgi:hypothetical protein